MALQIRGRHDLRFEFWIEAARNEVLAKINAVCIAAANPTGDDLSILRTSSPSHLSDSSDVSDVSPAHRALREAVRGTRSHAADILAPPKDALFQSPSFPDEALNFLPFIANKPWMAVARLKPRTFAMLTIGSRGDVQPYLALGLRLKRDGHRVVIVTHGEGQNVPALTTDEFKTWIEGYGIQHRQAGGDPTALMKLSAKHKV